MAKVWNAASDWEKSSFFLAAEMEREASLTGVWEVLTNSNNVDVFDLGSYR